MSILGMGRQPGQPRYNGSVHNLQITEAVLGTTIPLLFGTKRVHAKLLDFFNFNGVKKSAPTGKGIFGSKGNYYEYYATVVAALAQGPCGGILNVWDYSGQLENLTSAYSYTVPGGGGSVQPITTGVTPGSAAPIQFDLGVTKAVPYSVATNDYGGAPKTLTGTQNVPLTKVPSSPGAGQYSFDVSTGTYTFGAAEGGSNVAIVFSSTFSLYYFIQNQPAIVPPSPYQITPDNSSYFYQPISVTFIDTNTAGVQVGGTPSAPGQYNVHLGPVGSSVWYTFYSGDVGRPVYIKYSFTSSNSTVSSSSVLNLTFFNGALSQPPWSYSESANPSHALGYSAIAYFASENMDLGQVAQMPPYNYEVIGRAIADGQIDCSLCDVIPIITSDPLCGVGFNSAYLDTAGTWVNARAHWNANGFFISEYLTSSGGVSDILKRMCDAGNTAAFFSGGLLKMVPYSEISAVGNGSTYTPPTDPVGVLKWDDILLPSGQKPGAAISDDYITTDLKDDVDLYNYVQCNWTDRESSYNNDLMNQQNDAAIAETGPRIESAQDWSFICLRNAAQWALSCRLNRGLYINKTFKFSLTFLWDALEPMDVLVLPTGIPVRIQKIEEDDQQKIAIEAENFIYAASSATIYPTQPGSPYQPSNANADPGSSFPAFFEDTTQANGFLNNVLNIAVCGDTAAWGGCQIWISFDGQTYSQIGTVNEPCAIGILIAALASHGDPDTADTLSVDMSISSVALTSSTQQVADAFGTLCALISADQTKMEFISYATAALVAPLRYQLTYLRRGVYSSKINSFGAGDSFVYIGSGSIFKYQFPFTYYGKPIYFKFPSFNLQQKAIQPLSQCKAWKFIPSLQGSGIVESILPTHYSIIALTGSATALNLNEAYDSDFSTVAQLNSGNATGGGSTNYPLAGSESVNANQVGVGTTTNDSTALSGLPSVVPAAGSTVTLYATLSGNITISGAGGGGGGITLQYSLDAGSTWGNMGGFGGGVSTAWGPQAMSVSVPASSVSNINQIQFRVQATASVGYSGSSNVNGTVDTASVNVVTSSGGGSGAQVTVQYDTFGTGLTTKTMLLCIAYEAATVGLPAPFSEVIINASLDAGSTWSNLLAFEQTSTGGSFTAPSSGTVCLSVPAGTDLSKIQVQTECVNIGGSSGDATVDIAEIWMQ